MKVNIDVSSLTSKNLTGIGIYVQNLILNLVNIKGIQLKGSYKISRWKHYDEMKQNSSLIVIKPIIYNIPNIFIEKNLVFHGPDYWLPKLKNIKKVVTIHDFSVFQPNLWSKDFAQNGQKSINRLLTKVEPEHIIVVSDFVKNELIERFPNYKDRVTTVYHGADHFNQFSDLVKDNSIKKPYILCLGTIEYRKNQFTLVQAFDNIQQKFPDIELIIVGGNGGYLGKDITSQISKSKNVKILNYIPKAELDSLLANAMFSVYPSLYEGFGFPILESMAKGTPVITSNFGAMKEIAGNAALLVDTRNIDELAHALQSLIENSSLRTQLKELGKLRVAQFTWHNCAYNTLNVYQKALES